MFSPITNVAIKTRRYLGWSLVGSSLVLHILTVWCYSRLPDKMAAFTVMPMWFWGLIGLTLSAVGFIFLHASLSLAMSVIWALTIFFGSDESSALENIGHEKPLKGTSEPSRGRATFRVVSLNCHSNMMKDIYPVLKEWNPDIVFLQEVHPFVTSELAKALYDAKGDYRSYVTSGILTRWSIMKEYRFDQLRDLHVTIRNPENTSMMLDAVNVHLLTAATDASLWRIDCWRTHSRNRKLRVWETAHVLQHIENICPPRKYPVIIGGDFNSPARDACSRMLERDFTDTFQSVGSSWGNTFPSNLPMMRLDRFYTTSRIQPIRCAAISTPASDHNLLVADYVLLPE